VNDEQTTIAELKRLVAAFIAERDWERFHDPKNLSASIAIEAAELMEHFQWLRSDELTAMTDDARTMEKLREELADVVAYVLSFANRMGIDIALALEAKMRKNAIKYPAEQFKGRFR
jgi:NTP pyrophosphatase (non-canonical NTP hydrolase)